jgi:hypothetical protein
MGHHRDHVSSLVSLIKTGLGIPDQVKDILGSPAIPCHTLGVAAESPAGDANPYVSAGYMLLSFEEAMILVRI